MHVAIFAALSTGLADGTTLLVST